MAAADDEDPFVDSQAQTGQAVTGYTGADGGLLNTQAAAINDADATQGDGDVDADATFVTTVSGVQESAEQTLATACKTYQRAMTQANRDFEVAKATAERNLATGGRGSSMGSI